MTLDLIKAVILGMVEGLTEFLPVSSTGHLLLLEHFFGFDDDDFGKTFVVLIQLGAILAILSIYFVRLWQIAIGMFSDPAARRFVIGVLIAFLPAAVIGAALHGFIKGVAVQPLGRLLHADRRRRRAAAGSISSSSSRATTTPPGSRCRCISSSGCQCLAMIPGVSRSGATIVSAMLLGADKRSAAEFSFFLAMPTMVGAFALDLFKNYRR